MVLVSRPINSRLKTGRESTSCGVTNPRQVFNLAVVRALPEADFAGFPTAFAPLASALDQAFRRATFIPRINGTGHQESNNDYENCYRRIAFTVARRLRDRALRIRSSAPWLVGHRTVSRLSRLSSIAYRARSTRPSYGAPSLAIAASSCGTTNSVNNSSVSVKVT